MSHSTAPIGVLDSGIGGFSVVKQVQRLLPEEELLYFGDGAHIPYGNHPEERIAALEQTAFSALAAGQAGRGDVLLFQDPMRPDSLRRLADAVGKSCGGLAAVFSGEGEKWSYALVRADGADISPLVKELNQTLRGRGGGRNGFAQGSVPAGREAVEEFFKR